MIRPLFTRVRMRTLLLAGLASIAWAAAPGVAGAQEAGATGAATPAAAPVADCRDRAPGLVGLLFRPQIDVHCFVTRTRARRAPRVTPDGPRTTTAASTTVPGDPLASAPAPVDAPFGPSATCPPPGAEALTVEQIIAAVFRCRLTEAGWSEEDIRRTTAEALVVAECESRLDPAAVVFDGRYRDTPHANGNRYSAAGLFQFIRWTADKFVDGGYANVHDPVKNADAAARLVLFNVAAGRPGWLDWACVAVNDGFAKQSVLPGWPGGPAELPAWALAHAARAAP